MRHKSTNEVRELNVCRLFIAVAVPDGIKQRLRTAQEELKEILPPGATACTKWDNLHFTLRFLGAVEGSRLTGLSGQLRQALAGCGELNLICERLGCFPDLRFPRVVWAWIHDADERLGSLCRNIEASVNGFTNQPPESRFVGHVTIARLKQIKRAEAERLAGFVERATTTQFGVWRCACVELIQSELSPHGSRYTTLDVFPL